jgi:outer membrane protein assembly factor BamB
MKRFALLTALLFSFSCSISIAQLAGSAWPMRGQNPQHTGRGTALISASDSIKWRSVQYALSYASPTIATDGTVYYGLSNNKLYAVNPDGTEKWSFQTGDEIRSTAAIGTDGTIYVGSYDSYLYAINSDGIQKWRYLTGNKIYSSPAIGTDGTIYVGSMDNYLYAMNSDGTLKWKFQTGDQIYASPAISKDGSTIYILSFDDYLYAITSWGTLKWKYYIKTSNFNSPTVGSDGTVYVSSSDGYFYAIWSWGMLRWKFQAGSQICHSTPALGADGAIYVGYYDDCLYAIKPDGTLKWKYLTGDYVYSSPAVGTDETIYFGSLDSYFYSVRPDGTLKWKKSRAGAFGSPAIGTDGTVYSTSNGLCALAPEIQLSPIKVTSPNGNETWAVESLQNITWISLNVSNVKIEFSINNGSAWNIITESFDASAGLYKWTVPEFQSNSCLIRVSDAANNSVFDMSDSTFSIKIYPHIANSSWPMRGQNLQHTGRGIAGSEASNTLNWRYKTGNTVASSPAVGTDSTIYAGSYDGFLYAVGSDGNVKWKFQTGDIVYSSPAVASDGTVYFGSNDDNLYALNSNGILKWKYQTKSDLFSSPVIGPDGTVYIGSFDFNLYAINPDGTLKWTFYTGDGVFSSPAIGGDGTIYVGSYDHYLYAINQDGTLKWKYQTESFITYSSPAIGTDGSIYIGSYDNYLYSISSDGKFKWRFLTGGTVESSPSIGTDGTVYVGAGDKYLYAINSNGTLKWKYPTGDKILSSPSIGKGNVIYVGSYDKYLYAVNQNGTLKWKYQTEDSIISSPSIGADGAVYVGSNDGYLSAFKPESPITITSPNGGEIWAAGTSQNITWTTSYTLPNVRIEYSTDNGVKWNTISAEVYYYGGSYTWTVPQINSTSCLIRISDLGEAAINDVSDNVFTIKTVSSLAQTAWPMRGKDLLHTGRALESYSTSDSVKWKFLTGDLVNSSVAIGAHSTIYFGSIDKNLYSLNSEGTLNWKYPTGGNIYSSPAVSTDGTIYVGSRDKYLYAINSNGTMKWKFLSGGFFNASPSIGPDGTVYAGSVDRYLYAINPDGTLKWKYLAYADINSSPAVGEDGTVYFGSGYFISAKIAETSKNAALYRTFYAINSNGTLKWIFRTGGVVSSSPAIGAEGTIYFGCEDKNIYAVNPDSTLKWQYLTAGAITSSPAIGKDGTIFVGSSDKYLYAINSVGTLKWKYLTGNLIQSSPSIGWDGTIYIGSNDKYIYAINSDGTLKWKYQTGNYIISSPVINGDGTLYIGSNDKYLYAFAPQKTFSLTADFNNDGFVSLADLVLLGSMWGLTSSSPDFVSRYDLNNDGSIGLADLVILGSQWTGLGKVAKIASPAGVTLDMKASRNEANSMLNINVNMRNATGINGIAFSLKYDPNFYEFVEDSVAGLGTVSFANGTKPGVVEIASVYKNEKFSGIITLIFKAKGKQSDMNVRMMNAEVALNGVVSSVKDQSVVLKILPEEYALFQNSPNPFNPTTMIQYMIPGDKEVSVRLKIYDSRGALVRTLVDEARIPGLYSATWNATDNAGRRISSGIYFYRLEAGWFTQTRKMLFLR